MEAIRGRHIENSAFEIFIIYNITQNKLMYKI